MAFFVGIEIGGTKLQLAIGSGDGPPFVGFVRDTVETPGTAPRIQRQILDGYHRLLRETGLSADEIAGIGIGFGGPVDTRRGTIVTSHQVAGWNDFPIVDWLHGELGRPVLLHNDADSAAFAEAEFGAGRGYDPVLYVTVGSGIGGGLVFRGEVYRGLGAGALEIGHLRPLGTPTHIPLPGTTVESIASGFGITQRAQRLLMEPGVAARLGVGAIDGLARLCGGEPTTLNTRLIVEGARGGDGVCQKLLDDGTETLGWALAQAIALLNPARIVIGGGVSLRGETEFFEPVRAACRRYVFAPFRDLAQIVPAHLEEEVVVHGAVALAAQHHTAHQSPRAT
jgi:glucokinase